MKATGQEIAMWFVAHFVVWAVVAFIVYPFVVTPLYQTLFANGMSASTRGLYVGIIGFVVALIGWCVSLAIFLATRGPGAKAPEPPPTLNLPG